jgi:signal transduction histidine kinase
VRNLSRLRHRIDNSLVSLRIRHLGRVRSIHAARVSLRDIVDAARDELAGDAEQGQIAILVDGDAVTCADPRLIQSAIANLVGNAVKYTRPGGTIHVSVRETPNLVSVEIEDECGGLPEGKAEELFTPFTQRGADRTGFGLGLAITKDAIEAHHGSVQVTNLSGKGCVFMVTLPRIAAAVAMPE